MLVGLPLTSVRSASRESESFGARALGGRKQSLRQTGRALFGLTKHGLGTPDGPHGDARESRPL